MKTNHTQHSSFVAATGPSQRLAAIGLAIWVATSGHAQDLTHKGAPQTQPLLVRGATLHTVSHGVLEGAELLFVEGRIEAISTAGARLTLPEGGRVVEAAGQHLYPGFVCVASTLGLTEVESVDMTIDTSEAGDLNPEVVAAVAINPDSWWLPVTRRNGILTAGVMPTGGLVPGRVSVIRLDGWTTEDLTIERDAGLHVEWPFLGSSGRGRFGRRGGAAPAVDGEPLARLDALFDAALAYHRARAADDTVPVDLRLDGMGPTVRGERPVFVSAASVEQIESAVLWAAERRARIVIVGGRDALARADLLAEHGVPVALTAAHRLPHRRDLSASSTYELPAALEAKGVRWCMTIPLSGSANARNLPYEAAACVAYGLSREAALRSVTLSAAEALGVESKLGSLEVGKAATFFLADGDPLEVTTRVLAAFIDGRSVDLTDKQTELAAKYRAKYRQLGLGR